jgi:hypothetical protein
MKQVVVMIRTISGREHLSAFFTADRPMDIEAIKAEIGETLTHYMVPTAYLQLDKMPLTPNGKTDIKHLPEPVIAQSSSEYVAPKGKAEQDCCRLILRPRRHIAIGYPRNHRSHKLRLQHRLLRRIQEQHCPEVGQADL